jgi:hypothetical protein
MSDEDVAATQRLEKLVTGLDVVDLRLDLGSGWSVTTTLGHLAFWDREQSLNLAAWQRGTPPVGGDNSVNETLTPILSALEPRAAVELALVAARELDQVSAAIYDESRTEILSSAHDYVLRRARHRDEHIEQIERALAAQS